MNLKNIFICKSATLNPDKTFNILNGGINKLIVSFPKGADMSKIPPVNFALVGTIELEVTEMGKLHNLELSLMDQDGKRILPELRSNFQPSTSNKKGYHNILLEISTKFPSPGDYIFYINVDTLELGSHSFSVEYNQIEKR